MFSANPLGILCAMLISPAVVKADPDEIGFDSEMLHMNIIFAVLAGICFILCLFVHRSHPPSPPTSSASQIALPFKEGFIKCWKSRSFLVLMVCLGGGVGLFSAMYTLVQQVLCVKGYSNGFAGLCGALLIVGGLCGAAIAGVVVDKTKMFKEVIKVSYSFAAVAACAFVILTNFASERVAIAVLSAAFGFWGFAVYPIGLEAGVECTFPAAEATSSGLIVISGQVFGIILTLLMQMGLALPLGNSPDWSVETCSLGESGAGVIPVTNMMPATLLWAAAACAFAISVVIFFNPKYKRLAHEAEAQRSRDKVKGQPNPGEGDVTAAGSTNPGLVIVLPSDRASYGSTSDGDRPRKNSTNEANETQAEPDRTQVGSSKIEIV